MAGGVEVAPAGLVRVELPDDRLQPIQRGLSSGPSIARRSVHPFAHEAPWASTGSRTLVAPKMPAVDSAVSAAELTIASIGQRPLKRTIALARTIRQPLPPPTIPLPRTRSWRALPPRFTMRSDGPVRCELVDELEVVRVQHDLEIGVIFGNLVV